MDSTVFTALKHFIEHKMSMSHIYQPVMLLELLSNGGKSNKEEIAKAILQYDQSQVDYYKNIVTQMPGKVLKSHDVVESGPRGSGEFSLRSYEDLSLDQIGLLMVLCKERLSDYIKQRGERIWAHRDHSRSAISGSVRYEVLKRAQHRCELCGIHEDNRAVEVDHIIPKSLGGEDSLDNYQALCFKCNANKGNRDSTDFREWKNQYNHREDDCLFCNAQTDREIVEENELAYVIKDGFPVSQGHSLIIPKRHAETYFDLNQSEINACNRLIKTQKIRLEENDSSITGFNIGMNAGESAGQTVFHCHIHLIPRRDGDQDNPRGGVRRIFPEKADY